MGSNIVQCLSILCTVVNSQVVLVSTVPCRVAYSGVQRWSVDKVCVVQQFCTVRYSSSVQHMYSGFAIKYSDYTVDFINVSRFSGISLNFDFNSGLFIIQNPFEGFLMINTFNRRLKLGPPRLARIIIFLRGLWFSWITLAQ